MRIQGAELAQGRGKDASVSAAPDRGDQDDAAVRLVLPERLRRQPHEVTHIQRDEGSPLTCRVPELRLIVEPKIAHLVGADRFEARRSEDLRDPGGEVLVEVELHPTSMTRTSPG
ncbi:MAG: hypothetical protein A2X51_01885 [Candidatus Rokubacteria bacterium GWC2_70_24]|nr:MAG: hypothetical protein A2X51_01885 [Candidatus Rokubacteria bacterium GWC2_70_24]